MKPEIVIVEPPKPGDPIPWPKWAIAIAKLRIEGEIGIGDTSERIFGKFGGNQFKAAFRKMFGKDCGCDRRKKDWNQRFNYESFTAL